MNMRWALAGMVVVTAAVAWLALGNGFGGGASDKGSDASTRSDAAPEASKPGLSAPPPATVGADARHAGRCEIVGMVRRDGKPAAALVEARFVRGPEEREYESPQDPGTRAWWFADAGRAAPVAASGSAGADGRFSLGGLAPGAYRVVATSEDGAKGRAAVVLEADGSRVEANPALRAMSEVLRGRVLCGDGQPWKGTVIVTPEGSEGWWLGPERGAAVDAERTSTDEQGRFSVAGLAVGRVAVRAVEKDVMRVEASRVQVPFEGEYVLTIDGKFRELLGRVLDDADGSAIAGASVVAEAHLSDSVGWIRRATSDLGGRFRILAPPGKVEISVYAAGYRNRKTENSDPAAEVEFRLTKRARVRGRVTAAADGGPVEGIFVVADASALERTHYTDDASSEVTTRTDANGNYVLEEVLPTKNLIYAAGDGWIPAGFAKGAEEATAAAYGHDLEPGKEIVVDLTVVPGAKVTGVVLDPSGRPLSGATVGLGRRGGLSAGPNAVATSADGSFTLSTLIPTVEYRLEASAPGFAGATSETFVAAIDSPPRVEIRMPAPRWVTVTVLDDASGEPISGARVGVHARNDWGDDRETTDTKGQARVGPLAPDATEVTAWAEGFERPGREAELVGSQATAAEGAATVRLKRAEKTFEVSGRVLMPDGTPAAGAAVNERTAEFSVNSRHRFPGEADSRTDAAGAFRIKRLKAGPVALMATLSAEAEYFAVADAQAGQTNVAMTLAPGAGPGRIVIRVLDGDGKPVHSAGIQCSWGASWGVTHGRVEWDFGAEHEGSIDITDAKTADGKRAPWGNGHLDGVKTGGVYEIRLPPEVAIAGRVLGPDGQGVAEVGLRVARIGEAPSMMGRSRDEMDATTDSTGAFRIGGLLEGKYRLTVAPPPQFIVPKSVDTATGSKDVKFVLRIGAHPTITVLDAAGQPIAGARVLAYRGSRPEHSDAVATNRSGEVRIPNLDPALPYTLWVRQSERWSELAAVWRHGWKPADTTIRLAPPLRIAGFVRDEAGHPIENAQILAEGSEIQGDLVNTDAKGAFVVGFLPPGDVSLRVMRQGVVDGGPDEASPQHRTVAAGTEDVVLVLDAGVELEVRIENWPSDRTRTAMLSMDGALGGQHGVATVGYDGVVRFPGAHRAATYTLWVPEDEAGNSVFAPGLRVSETAATARLAPGRSIRGHVEMPPGEHFMTVVEASGPGVPSAVGTLHKDGTFEIRGLPEGTWKTRVALEDRNTTIRFLGSARIRTGEAAEIPLRQIDRLRPADDDGAEDDDEK